MSKIIFFFLSFWKKSFFFFFKEEVFSFKDGLYYDLYNIKENSLSKFGSYYHVLFSNGESYYRGKINASAENTDID